MLCKKLICMECTCVLFTQLLWEGLHRFGFIFLFPLLKLLQFFLSHCSNTELCYSGNTFQHVGTLYGIWRMRCRHTHLSLASSGFIGREPRKPNWAEDRDRESVLVKPWSLMKTHVSAAVRIKKRVKYKTVYLVYILCLESDSSRYNFILYW